MTTMFANLSDQGSGPLLTRTPQGKLLALVEVPDNCTIDGDVGTMRRMIVDLLDALQSAEQAADEGVTMRLDFTELKLKVKLYLDGKSPAKRDRFADENRRRANARSGRSSDK